MNVLLFLGTVFHNLGYCHQGQLLLHLLHHQLSPTTTNYFTYYFTNIAIYTP